MKDIKRFKFAGSREGIRIVGEKNHFYGVKKTDAVAFETYMQPKLGYSGATLLPAKSYKHSKWVFFKLI